MYPRWIPIVTGPAPSSARSFPNLISRSRSSSERRRCPRFSSRKIKLALFDRLMVLPTSIKSRRWSAMRSPKSRAFRDLRVVAGSWRSIRRSISIPHSSASFRRRNVSLTYFPFRRTWTLQEPDLSFVMVATRVRSVCTEASKSRIKRRIMAYNSVHTTRSNSLKILEKC